MLKATLTWNNEPSDFLPVKKLLDAWVAPEAAVGTAAEGAAAAGAINASAVAVAVGAAVGVSAAEAVGAAAAVDAAAALGSVKVDKRRLLTTSRKVLFASRNSPS